MRVFITGVSRGLGAGFARVALEQGHEVWGCSRHQPEALRADHGERFRFRSLDLGRPEEAEPALRAWLNGVEGFGRVILNAGMLAPIADLRETSLETLRDTMEVNVWANKWILDALFRRGRGIGQVVAISSGASVSGHRGWNAYGISKAALNMLVKLYAAERAETHFTALAPGLIDTAMQDALRATPEDPRFPTLERLKAAQGTDAMPDAESAARLCWDLFPRLRQEPSGSYLDVRKIGTDD